MKYLFWFLMSLFSLAHAGPVVVELYESQGCSSCPPAEAVMRDLKKEFGDQVLLFTHHVDYWDYLGWVDTFSNAKSTERQRAYTFQFKDRSMYTPEMIINGEVGFVGSDLRRARSEIQKRLTVAIISQLTWCKRTQASLKCVVPENMNSEVSQAILIYSANRAPVSILRGENKGAVMSGDHVVIDFQMKSPQHSRTNVWTIPAQWNEKGSHVSVLFQDPSLRVLSAETFQN